jgi:hypothetical protein
MPKGLRNSSFTWGIKAADGNKRCGGNGVDRNGGAQPRSEDYGVRGSSVRNFLSLGEGIYFIGSKDAPPILLRVLTIFKNKCVDYG